MNLVLLITALVILLCVWLNILSGKLGVPVLLAFILLGMAFGSDGIVKIDFYNFAAAERIRMAALIFIMFYGGFGTNWKEAKKVAVQAGLLSSLGVVLTAGFVGLFAHFVCKFSLFNSFLIGSVIASTDAASVFAILRDKHLNLKYNTASLLELESGSNDPFAYMLTIIVLSTAQSRISAVSVAGMIFMQLLLGIAFGTGFAIIAKYVINKAIIKTPGFDIVFIIAIVLLAYAATSMLGGNGYLSVYITGIILGNTDIPGKKELVPFFDGITGLMQIVIFFPFGTPCISFKASSDSSDCLNFGGLYHTYCQTVYGITAAAV